MLSCCPFRRTLHTVCSPWTWLYMAPLRLSMNKKSTFQKPFPGRIINQLDICRLFCPAYLKGATPLNAIKGFEASGIFPYNRNIFGDEMFAAASLAPPEPDPNDQLDCPSASSSIIIPVQEPTQCTPSESNACSTDELSTSPSNLIPAPEPRQCTPPATSLPTDSSTSANQHSPNPDKQSQVTEILQARLIAEKQITPAHTRPIPRETRQNITKRKRKIQKAEILTSTPIKDEQFNKLTKSLTKNMRQEKKKPKLALDSTGSIQQIKKAPPRHASDNPLTSKQGKNEKSLRTNKKNTPKKTSDQPEPAYFCTVCREPYKTPIVEDWIECSGCQNWTHKLCSTYMGYGSYFCDECDD